jgi:ribosomal protein S18 acetylase RimI-like enzyme
MDEYLWLAKNSNAGIKLYSTAYEYAKSQGCDYISMNVVENNPASPRVKDLYLKLGFEKDSETYIKKI